MERSFYFYDSEGYHENVFISCELVRDAKVQVWNQISTWRTVMGGE